MLVGSYLLHVYCDNGLHTDKGTKSKGSCLDPRAWAGQPFEPPGETRAECIRVAREQGWLISTKRQICPYCRGIS